MHHAHVTLHARHGRGPFERRHDEPRETLRLRVLLQPIPHLLQQLGDLGRPVAEHARDADAEPLLLLGHLGRQRTERRSRLHAALHLHRDHGVDEHVQSFDRIERALAQDRETTLTDQVELPGEDLVPELFLRLEVVIEVALAAKSGTSDYVVH